MHSDREVLVLGAGVIGLSTGIVLLKEKYKVTIWARDLPPYTTSNKAAAVWFPFKCGSPQRAIPWLKLAQDYFNQHILGIAENGCRPTIVVEAFDHNVPDPWWKPGIASYRRISPDKLPARYMDGYELDGIMMNTDVYMAYLVKTYLDLGGQLIQKEIRELAEATTEYSLVINCTGLGARELCNDQELYPIRGQIIRTNSKNMDYSIFDQEGPNGLAYIIPRFDDTMLGGTAQNNNWSLEIDEKDREDILRKCRNISPLFSDVEILEERVGLRPGRDEIRLESEKRGTSTVIHNYGHGGSGFTLSWGCALEVLDLVRKA